jgi:hypothetical protein
VPPNTDRRRTIALATAAGCALGAVAVGVLGLGFQATHDRDAAIMHGFTGLAPDRLFVHMRVVELMFELVSY